MVERQSHARQKHLVGNPQDLLGRTSEWLEHTPKIAPKNKLGNKPPGERDVRSSPLYQSASKA